MAAHILVELSVSVIHDYGKRDGVTVRSKFFINFVIFIFEYIMNSNVNGAFKRINHSFVFWWRQM